MRPPQQILIILMGALGDVVRGFSVLSPLRELYPDARITWLVEPKCEGIVRLHPLVDEVIVFRRPKKEGLSRVSYLDRSLQAVTLLRGAMKGKFDLVLDLQRHSKSGFFSWMTRCPRRIGFHRSNAKEGNWLFNTETIPSAPRDLSKVDHYLYFPSHLGAPLKQVDFGLKPLVARNFLSSEVGLLLNDSISIITLVMGSSWESKNWPAPGYVGLIEGILSSLPHSITLVGDGSQRGIAEEVVNAVKNGPFGSKVDRVINLVAKTTLHDLVIVLGLSEVAVGPDSGPGHIAASLGVPYVGIFGPTEVARVAPYRQEHLAVTASLGCMPCWRRKCPGLGGLCMRLATPDIVYLHLERALSSRA
jgi:heptosyltransferase I